MGVYKNNNGNLELISGATLWADMPIACEIKFDGQTVPNGFLACDGSTFSPTDYPELYAALGSTTLPNNSGYIIKAQQTALPADFMDALDDKQDATDNNLETTDKTVVGAINEVNTLLNDITELGNYVSLRTAGAVGNFKYSDYRFIFICLRVGNFKYAMDSALIPTSLLDNEAFSNYELNLYESPNNNISAILSFQKTAVSLGTLNINGFSNFSDVLVFGIK